MDKEDYKIDWAKDAEYIKRVIDSVGYPYLGAYTYVENQKVGVLDAKVLPDVKIENRTSGKIIFIAENLPVVVCGSGLLKLKNVIDDLTKNSILPLKKFRLRFR